MNVLFYTLAILAGISNPIQSAANAALNKSTAQPLATAAVIYAVALAGLAVLAARYGIRPKDGIAALAHAPWWAYVGGLCNVVFVLAGAIATREIGSAAFTVTTLTCAIVVSVSLDRFGLLGLEAHALTWQRCLGASFSVAGVILVSKF